MTVIGGLEARGLAVEAQEALLLVARGVVGAQLVVDSLGGAAAGSDALDDGGRAGNSVAAGVDLRVGGALRLGLDGNQAVQARRVLP